LNGQPVCKILYHRPYLSTVLEKLAKFFKGILFWRARYIEPG